MALICDLSVRDYFLDCLSEVLDDDLSEWRFLPSYFPLSLSIWSCITAYMLGDIIFKGFELITIVCPFICTSIPAIVRFWYSLLARFKLLWGDLELLAAINFCWAFVKAITYAVDPFFFRWDFCYFLGFLIPISTRDSWENAMTSPDS